MEHKSVKYIDTGIVLNVRPRISEDGAEVTMQTETIVSSAIYDASEASLKPEERSPPSIESKTVQALFGSLIILHLLSVD